MVEPPPIGIHLRIDFGPGARLGPGKAALLEQIARTGSISAAGRALGMSYRRAWVLVDAVNGMLPEPSVRASAGGQRGGGASLTPYGARLLAAYREFEREMAEEAARRFEAFRLPEPEER